MVKEARGDNDDIVDSSSKRSGWCAGCGWRPALRAIECYEAE